MKPSHFIYSQRQRDIAKDYQPRKKVNEVFCNGTFIPYTEINSTGDSNFDDAQHLGVHPRWWIRCNGVIQDEELKQFINQGDSK